MARQAREATNVGLQTQRTTNVGMTDASGHRQSTANQKEQA
jgi:hypothetical protein